MHLRPPEAHRTMGWLECHLLELPAGARTRMTLHVQGRMAFLAVSEHPPAVHAGAVLPPAALQVTNPPGHAPERLCMASSISTCAFPPGRSACGRIWRSGADAETIG